MHAASSALAGPRTITILHIGTPFTVCYITRIVAFAASLSPLIGYQRTSHFVHCSEFRTMNFKNSSPLFLYLVALLHQRNHPKHGPPSKPSGCLLMSNSSHEDQTFTSPKQPTSQPPERLDFWTLLGHPHDQASPQPTEPFWQQFPEIAYPQSYYYPQYDFYTLFPIYHAFTFPMDSAPIVIGFKSRYARPDTKSVVSSKMKRPRQVVNVFLEDEYVGEITLGVLVRFSKLAKASFPRPQTDSEKQADSSENAIAKNQTINSDLENGQSEKESWADMADAAHAGEQTAPSEVEDTAITSPTPAAQETASTEHLEPKELTIRVAGAWLQPNISVTKHILNWMQQNKRTRNNEPLLPLTPLPLTSISLKALVDTYTGVLAFDLAPFPQDLRHAILTRLTEKPTQASQMQYLYEHLPLEDAILNRMVTSYFEHLEAGHYSQSEIDAIHTYVQKNAGDDGELDRHFSRVKRSRARKQSREDAMKTLREGFEDFAGPMEEALLDTKDKGKEDSAQAAEPEGRRRNRRQQQSNGELKGKASDKAKGSAPKGKNS